MEQTASCSWVRVAKGTLLGLAASFLSALLLTVLFSALLALGIPNGILPLFAHLTLLLAAVAGGFAAGRKGKEKGLLLGLCTAAAFLLIHLLITALFGDLSPSFLTYGAAELLGGVLGVILGVNLRKN